MSIVIENAIISYPHLFKPVPPKGSTVDRYSAQFIVPPTFDWAEVKAAIEAAKVEKWGGAVPLNMKTTLSQVEDGPFKGYWQISAGAYVDNPPIIVDQNVNPLMDKTTMFAGCHINAEVFQRL